MPGVPRTPRVGSGLLYQGPRTDVQCQKNLLWKSHRQESLPRTPKAQGEVRRRPEEPPRLLADNPIDMSRFPMLRVTYKQDRIAPLFTLMTPVFDRTLAFRALGPHGREILLFLIFLRASLVPTNQVP